MLEKPQLKQREKMSFNCKPWRAKMAQLTVQAIPPPSIWPPAFMPGAGPNWLLSAGKGASFA